VTHQPTNPAEIEALYPEGSAPEIRIERQSALCSYGHSQIVLSGGIRQVLMQHFADSDQIILPTVRAFLEREGVWSADETTGIVIEALSRWRPELTEARPAIIIKEGEWQWKREGIGDFLGAEYQDGTHHYAGYWSGTHTMFALGNESAETQLLASEIAKTLLWYQSTIAEAFDLDRFIVVSIGALAALKESRETFVVPVNVAYVLTESWYTRPDAPRLKRIQFKASEFIGYGGLP
jgi:hypothetical protein